jgi:ubiquinone/menaquinone biosynthesis C-methylase UbiE
MLQKDLDAILTRLHEPGNQLLALDACGGSGNASLKLLKRHVNVTLCDISSELIELFKEKCLKQGYTNYSTVCKEIGEYLSTTTQKFDLIVFCSALHHIEDYTSILRLAAKHLKRNGYIYTVFDPVKWSFPTFQVIWVDWLLHAATCYPRELFSSFVKSFSQAKNEGVLSEADLRLTEYHVRSGIDDCLLVNSLKSNGLGIVVHERYFDARHKVFRMLLYAIRRSTGFKLLLRTK